jgi:CelD/BcsL family acetyltransferase involved in cellulose biosynthesis
MGVPGPIAPDSTAPPMKRRVEPFLSTGPLPEWWAPLFEASGSDSVFLSPAWMATWVAVYGADFTGSWVCWEQDGRVVAGCLLVERVIRIKGVPFRSQFLNATGKAEVPTPLAEFNDVLHLPGHGDAVAVDFAHLLQERSWGRLLLSGHEADSVVGRALEAVGGTQTEQRCQPSPFVDLRVLGDKPFESTVTGKSGTHLRRNRRDYEAQLGEVGVRRAESIDEALRFFDELRVLHLARWTDLDRSTSLAADAVVDFHRRVIRALFDGGGIDLLRVGNAERPVGFLYNFVVRGKVSMFQSGFDYEPSSKRSPGLLTHALAIEHYRQRGLREYDFLSGDAQYKRTLCNGVRELMWTTIYRDRPWIRMLLAARRLRARMNGALEKVPEAA